MAAQKTFKAPTESTSSLIDVIKSKRRKFEDDNDEDGSFSQADCHLKNLLAKELADYLDRTIEEVEKCDKDDCKHKIKEEEQADDFRLFSFSTSLQYAEEEQNCKQESKVAAGHSSDSEDDDETTARLKEAAVSVQDIFGSKFNHTTQTF